MLQNEAVGQLPTGKPRSRIGSARRNRANAKHIEARLSRLETLGREELIAAWIEAFEVPPPRNASQNFLIKAVGHHLQVQVFGDIRPATRKALLKIAADFCRSGQVGDLPAPQRRLKPGSRLIRAWRGQTHEVLMLSETRFEWQGRTWPSLSTIATAITGTRRNGPAFFGLRPPGGAP